MRLDRFDLNLLVALDVILEERNVTRASARLHIGQSAASSALARLRDYFEDELLVPVGRRMVLTPLAERLLAPVRDTLHSARATIALKPGFDPATAERHFMVCASDYATTVLMAEVVRRVAAAAPGLVLDIRSPMQDVFEVFERGNIDLLVLPEQYMKHFPNQKIRLFEDPYVCMVWDGSAMVADTLTMDGYMAAGHVTIHFGDERNTAFEEWFVQNAGKRRKVELSVDNFSILPLVMVGTHRVATLHKKQAVHFARHFPLRLMDTPFAMPPVVEMMSWPNHLERDPAHAWLRDVVAACVADLPDHGNPETPLAGLQTAGSTT